MGYGENQQEIFLGHSITQTKNVSEADRADDRSRRSGGSSRRATSLARTILADNRHHLDRIAQALLEHETLTGEEIGAIMRGEPLTSVRRDEQANPAARPPASAARCRPPRARAAASLRPGSSRARSQGA